jgi:inosose dehydratase
MRLAYQTNTWGGVVGHPAGVTSIKDLYYLANGSTGEALRDISAAGYRGFELFDGNLVQFDGQEDTFRNLLAETGLAFVGVYSGANFIYPEILPEELHKIDGVAARAARLGSEHLVVGGGALRSSGTTDDDYDRFGAGLDQVVEIAGRHGLTPSFHPHLGTCAQTPEQIARVFERTSIGFCPDTAHLEAAGGDSAALIRALGDRIPYVHLKDYRDGAFLPLGQGDLDFERILDSLDTIGYDGWITVELDAWSGSLREAAIESRIFLEGRSTPEAG